MARIHILDCTFDVRKVRFCRDEAQLIYDRKRMFAYFPTKIYSKYMKNLPFEAVLLSTHNV